MNIKPRKRLFIGLLLSLEVVFALGLFILWYIPSSGYENFGKSLSIFWGWAFGFIMAVFTLGIVFLVAIILRQRFIIIPFMYQDYCQLKLAYLLMLHLALRIRCNWCLIIWRLYFWRLDHLLIRF